MWLCGSVGTVTLRISIRWNGWEQSEAALFFFFSFFQSYCHWQLAALIISNGKIHEKIMGTFSMVVLNAIM